MMPTFTCTHNPRLAYIQVALHADCNVEWLQTYNHTLRTATFPSLRKLKVYGVSEHDCSMWMIVTIIRELGLQHVWLFSLVGVLSVLVFVLPTKISSSQWEVIIGKATGRHDEQLRMPGVKDWQHDYIDS